MLSTYTVQSPSLTLRSPWLGRPLAITAAAWCASEIALGAYFGFGTLGQHVEFWTLAILLALGAFMIADRAYPSTGFAALSVRMAVLAFAIVSLSGLVFGSLGLIDTLAFGIGEAAAVGTALLVAPRSSPAGFVPRRDLPVAMLGLWAAVLAFVIGSGISHSPFTLYDSLSYHLYFPARWLQAHRLSIIPTPFSDEAQAYQPANGELWFLWLMLPFHGDFIARMGQLPFYLLGGTTAYALANRLGASPVHAMYAPAFFLIAPPVVEQAVGANVDLIHAALFSTSLFLGIVAVDTDTRRDWVLWGISVGLWLGTKYLALVYAPIVFVIPLIRGPRRRALWAAPGMVVFGLSWYARNWLIAGSPIYPAMVRVFGFTVGEGAYTRHAMTRSFLHTTDPRLLAVSLAHAFGTPLFLFAAPALLLVALSIVVRRLWWPAGFICLASVAGVLLCWIGVADNLDSRFLLPSVVSSFSLLPVLFCQRRRLNGAVHIVYGLAILWVLFGVDAQPGASLPWFMRDWLSLHGLIGRPYVWVLAGLSCLAMAALRLAPGRPWVVPAAVAFIGAASATLAIGAETWCVPSRCDFLQLASPHVRPNFLFGSRWLTANVSGAHVAYAGINLPYPLSGSHLDNVVSYVNIDRHADWRFDDYVRAARRSNDRASTARPLASASGVLMAAERQTGLADALRPRYERISGDYDAWFANLESHGIGYLFVSTLDPYEITYVWHNAAAFPIEDEWARTHPSHFQLVYQNPDARIYRVTP